MKRLVPPAVLLAAACAAAPPPALGLAVHQRPLDGGLATATGPASLTRARVGLSSLEVFPCPATGQRRWRALVPWGTAWAHETSTPTRLGGAFLLELSGEYALELGTLAPPAGRYCRARVVFAPFDVHAGVGPELLGRSLVLELAQPGAARTLESRSLRGADLELTPPLELAAGDEAVLTVELDAARWLEGVDPAAPDAGTEALARVAATASAHHGR